jgi:hypothetical protein
MVKRLQSGNHKEITLKNVWARSFIIMEVFVKQEKEEVVNKTVLDETSLNFESHKLL